MEQSILNSTKKMLGVGADDTSFDLDILTHINTAFTTLTDMGVGPEAGFAIEDDEAEWEDFIADDLVQLSKVKACVFLRTRLLFDPPTVSYLLEAMQNQLQEQEWRLNVNREGTDWVDPDPAELMIVDGGDPTGP